GPKGQPAITGRSSGPSARRGEKLPLLGDDDATADRNYIKEFLLARRRALGRQHGLQYAEAFHHIGGGSRRSAVEEYIKRNAVPVRYLFRPNKSPQPIAGAGWFSDVPRGPRPPPRLNSTVARVGSHRPSAPPAPSVPRHAQPLP